MAHSVSRSQLFAGLLAAVLMAMGSPALAAKKKKAADAAAEGGEPGLPTSGKAAEGAAQASDTERPKPMLEDENAPAEDAQGNVSFVGNKSGNGRITVRAPKKEKAKVYLEGRYFGIAPKTIKKIPPGDYIIEVTYPNGNRVTKPVSVSGDEEAVVELGGADEATAPTEKPMPPETIEKRLGTAKVIGIGAIGLAVVGAGLGAWTYMIQQDYNKIAEGPQDTASRQRADDLAKKGDNLALAANICFVGAAAGLIAAGIIGYPAWKAKKARGESGSPEAPAMSFMLAPNRHLDGVNAGFAYRF